MAKTVLSWTGDLPFDRKELTKALDKVGIAFSSKITRKTTAVAVGRNPKMGQLCEAQLNNVPQVTPDYLSALMKSGALPEAEHFLITVQPLVGTSAASSSSSTAAGDRPSDAAASRHLRGRGSAAAADSSYASPSYSHQVDSKKRRLNAYPTSESLQSIEVTHPAKRSKTITRSLSTSSTQPKKAMHDASHIKYASSDDPGAVIALEGLIGIGKSTLCNKLLQLYPEEVDVYREETNEKFLQLFYSDPKRYGFALQWGMLKSRIYQLRLAQHDTRHGRWPHRDLLFWDRSMIGDYTFALWNHLLGGISREEMEAYESEFGGSVRQLDRIAFLKDVQLFVLMNDEPARCKTRVEVNRKNASEQGIPLSYYEGLDDVHFHMFIELLRSRVAKVIVQPWGEYDDAESCRALYEDAISGRTILPTVIDEPSGLRVSSLRSSESVLVYKNDKEIVKQYQLISSAHTVAIDELKGFRDIYVPRDVLLIDPTTKGVSAQHLEQYNIKFYDNAFKRIVLFHLGHNQNIHFYDSL
jgi:deoxyadenosine/deoxycytidine kinase